jgi:galactan 5-O-arabinofuranosyltransferase
VAFATSRTVVLRPQRLAPGRDRDAGRDLGRWLGPALVLITSATMSGLSALALNGTRWSFNAIYSDAGFRTEAVTRFADSPALADYGYRGLPSYYPPALPWIEGRIADLLGVPGWTVMKPVTLVLAALVPLLALLLWRRVVPQPVAGAVVAATSLLAVDLVKPDEWLVLSLVVPWWLELVRGVRRPGVRPLPLWAHGAIMGGLLLFHSFYFVPLGLATVVGLALDALARRPMPLRPLRGLAVLAVGLLVSTPYWLPSALLRLQGVPADSLQMRWSPPGFTHPPLPLPPELSGLLGLVGLVWLLRRVRTDRLAAAVALALGSSYAFFVGGQWLQRYGVAVLPEKADDLLVLLLVASGVLGLADLTTGVLRVSPTTPARVLTLALVVVLAVPAVATFRAHWVTGIRASTAQHMRYPDGTWPSGGPPENPATHKHPWSVNPQGIDEPSVREVSDAYRSLGGRLDDRTVLVTSRADLLATTPVHPFTAWKSIYSHPAGRFQDRLAVLRRAADCRDSRCVWQLLYDNRFDRVDGLVLTRSEEGLRLSVTTDLFPDGWETTRLSFPAGLFKAPWFDRRDVGDVAVIRLR